jgi:hypothetical protein
MKTPIRLLGTALGTAALVGTTAVGANAYEGSHHHYSHHHHHGSHHHYRHYGAYSVRGAHQAFSHYIREHDHQGRDSGFTVGRDFNHRWFKHHWNRHHHVRLTFAQRQAAILARLTDADNRLGKLITRLQAAAADNPNGWQAQAVPYLQAQQERLEKLIAAVKAATNYRELAEAFRATFAPPASNPTPPSDTPTPSPAA